MSVRLFAPIVAIGLALGLLGAACSSSVQLSTAPAPAKCQVTLSMSTGTIGATGAAGSVTVNTDPECAWTASADVSWITGLAPASGQGAGQVQFQVGANSSPTSRQGDITLNGQEAQITQLGAACQFTVTPLTQAIGSTGGSGSFAVAGPTGCTWTAASQASFVTVTSGASGNGAGTVQFSVTANTGVARVGAIAVAGQTFQVTQASGTVPVVPCVFTLDATSQSVGPGGGTAGTEVHTDPSCSWTVASNVSWMTVVGNPAGAGTLAVSLAVMANTGSSRTGTATIAGQAFTVTEDGSCASSVSPPSQSLTAAGGPAVANVTTASGCAWTATAADPWLTITAGSSGNGNGTVDYTAAANTGPARNSSLTIAGQTLTVMEAGGCVSSINPTSEPIAAAGGAGTPVAVTTAAGCAWTATTASTWITITSGASGTGNGSVGFSAAANSGSARTDTVTIAGQTLTVNQAGGCSASINPTSETVPVAGGAGTPVAVTVGAGCAWTASTTTSWLTVTSGASGTGNGTVNFTAAANTGSSRSGTITIAGLSLMVTQGSGCSFSINPTSESSTAAGGAGTPVAVTTTAGCTWTAVANNAFLTVTSGASGTGNGMVGFTVAANTGPALVGTLTIATNTLTVNQASGCTFGISPSSQNFTLSGGAGGPVTVTTAAGCTWTSSTTASWITINTGASGTGNGTVTFTVAANAGAARNGTITIAGQTFTVMQAKGN